MAMASSSPDRFAGRHYRGRGDTAYLRLLDTARRMFEPDPELPNLSMLYTPHWNGLVEGPTWDAWWIQNSYGTTYCALPFYQEPFVTFLQNSQDLWFDQMGDGKRAGAGNYVAPDGCLCDAARPGLIYYRQGDGRVDIHDWGMEFTAAGLLMQSELLLISRDAAAIKHYLPMLERCANFLDSRRDPSNNLYLAGPAGNLLAPSYAGWARPDGTYGKAYLAGLSITTIAALDRLIEVEKLAGRSPKRFEEQRTLARKGLPLLLQDGDYFIRSLDPDGVKHGVYGAPAHGYFETSPNQDAIAFRVAGDALAKRIYKKIASIPELRPHDLILPNYPSYDDMYEKPEGLWAYGTWVNGGEWTTCEARMMMAYYRLGHYDDTRRSMERILDFAHQFRMDNPLTDRGAAVYQPNQPFNITYDAFGAPAALIRGLFEYLYRADGLTLIPHIPPSISELQQLDPVRFGRKRIYLSTVGTGPITAVRVNGHPWDHFDATSVFLPYHETPNTARILIARGGAKPRLSHSRTASPSGPSPDSAVGSAVVGAAPAGGDDALQTWETRLTRFEAALRRSHMGNSYEAAHARLALQAIAAVRERHRLEAAGRLSPLPPASQAAVDTLYSDTATHLCEGLAAALKGYEKSPSQARQRILKLWNESATAAAAGE
ncbi:MAG TPA: hypothetical protein VFJ58_20345 [Armatimonadota bacterium]|nr:hypothetical protein [Armatimonadota bacterium]